MNKLNEIYDKCVSAFTESAFYKKLYKLEWFKNIVDSSFFNKLFNYETISYIFFGVLTTIINFVAAAIVLFAGEGRMPPELLVNVSTGIAWVVAVLFAYITNKIFVFDSKAFDAFSLIKELGGFLAARLFSLGFELVWMNVTVNFMHLPYFICKFIAQFVIVALNYVFSKLFIFKKETEVQKSEQ